MAVEAVIDDGAAADVVDGVDVAAGVADGAVGDDCAVGIGVGIGFGGVARSIVG